MSERRTTTTAPSAAPRSRSSSGKAFVEFVLVAPVVLFISMYTLHLVQILQANQIAMVLSREMATEAYKTCADITLHQACAPPQQNPVGICVDVTQTPTAVRTCLLALQTRYQNLWTQVRPGSALTTPAPTFLFEVYVYALPTLLSNTTANGNSGGCNGNNGNQNGISCTKISTGLTNFPTRTPPDQCLTNQADLGLPSDLANANSFCMRKRIVRASVTFQINAITTFLSGVVPSSRVITDETIM